MVLAWATLESHCGIKEWSRTEQCRIEHNGAKKKGKNSNLEQVGERRLGGHLTVDISLLSRHREARNGAAGCGDPAETQFSHPLVSIRDWWQDTPDTNI
jgi:hypothetical protein